MGVANFPFPSFTLILTSDRVVIPGPSYAIRLAPLVVSYAQNAALQINTKPNESDDVGTEDCPLVDLSLENDSTTDVAVGDSDTEELNITETIMSTSTYETRTVQTTRSKQEEVGKKNSSDLRFPSEKYIQEILN